MIRLLVFRSWLAAPVCASGLWCFFFGWPAHCQPLLDLPTVPISVNLVYDTAYLAYFKAGLSSVPLGLSVNNGLYKSWCTETAVDHKTNDTYRLYNSLGTLPGEVMNPNWHAVNWVLNHKPALTALPAPEQEVQTEVVQQVIWKLVTGSYFTGGGFPLYDGVHESPDLVGPLYAQALANNGFVPQPGQVIAVVMDPTDGPANAQTVIIEVTAPTRCSSPTDISSNFAGAGIRGGSYVWFNSRMKVTGAGSGTTILFHNQMIRFTAGQSYRLNVPDGQISFSSSVSCATTLFDADVNTWKTTVPLTGSDEIFISGLAFPMPSGLPHTKNSVFWQGEMSTNTPGVNISWEWGSAMYSKFTLNYNSLQVQPTHGNFCSRDNSDHAGTPEAFKQYGERRGGGSNLAGSSSGMVSFTPQCMF